MASAPATTSRIHVLHDATALSRLVGVSHPCCHAVALPFPLRPSAGGPAVLAAFVEGNPLADDWALDVELPGQSIVIWSGTLADDLFGDEPRTWMSPGHEAFREFCDGAAPTLVARGRRLAFRPHARHVLSDVQGCLNFLRVREGQPFDLAWGPADLLTVEMLADAEDHLVRAFESLGPRVSMVLLHDVASDGEALRPLPFGQGRLPHALIRRLLSDHVPPSTPIVLLPGGLEDQIASLGAPGGFG